MTYIISVYFKETKEERRARVITYYANNIEALKEVIDKVEYLFKCYAYHRYEISVF